MCDFAKSNIKAGSHFSTTSPAPKHRSSLLDRLIAAIGPNSLGYRSETDAHCDTGAMWISLVRWGRSDRPSSGFDIGTLRPCSGFAIGTLRPCSGFDIGTFRPSPGFDISALGPGPGFDVGAFGPCSGFDVGAFGPCSGFNVGAFGPSSGFDVGALRPGSSFHVGALGPDSGYQIAVDGPDRDSNRRDEEGRKGNDGFDLHVEIGYGHLPYELRRLYEASEKNPLVAGEVVMMVFRAAWRKRIFQRRGLAFK